MIYVDDHLGQQEYFFFFSAIWYHCSLRSQDAGSADDDDDDDVVSLAQGTRLTITQFQEPIQYRFIEH